MWAGRSIPWKPYRSTNSAVRLYQDNQTMASLFLPFQNICAQVHATTCPTIFLQLELHAAPSLTRSAFRYSFFRCFSLFLNRIENYLKIKTKSKSNQIEHTLCACFLCDNGRFILSLLLYSRHSQSIWCGLPKCPFEIVLHSIHTNAYTYLQIQSN